MSEGSPPRSRGGGEPDPARVGLCPSCRHVRVLSSPKGSTFLLCQLAKADPSLPKYPPQPRMVCSGYVR